MNNIFNNTNQLLVVIVLYNTAISDSESYQSLAKGFYQLVEFKQKVDLMVINNGPTASDCKVDDSIFNIYFEERLDNPGVSEAYNMAGRIAKELGKSWLLLLDQDTRLPVDFWSHYSQSLSRYSDLPVHAPRLWDGKLMVSPCGYSFYRGHVLPNLATGIHRMKGRNVLNSGLLVSLAAFLTVGGYDESVRLYFSDFVFFDRLKAVYDEFAVIDVDLMHDLSSSDYSTLQIATSRFLLYCQGARAAAEGDVLRSVLYFLTVGARSIVMSRRLGTLTFIRIFLRTWF